MRRFTRFALLISLSLLVALATHAAFNPFVPRLPTPPTLRILAKPSITGVYAPSCIRPGYRVRIVGRNFGYAKGKLVVLGPGIRVKVLSWNSSQIYFLVPADRRLVPGASMTVSLYTDPFVTRRYVRITTASKRLLVCRTAIRVPTIPRPVIRRPVIPRPVLPRPPAPKPSPSAPPKPPAGGSEESGGEGPGGEGSGEGGSGGGRARPGSDGTLTDRDLPPPPKFGKDSGGEGDEGDDGGEGEGEGDADKPAPPPSGVEAGELMIISKNMTEASQLGLDLQGDGYGVKRRRRLPGLNLAISVLRLPNGTGLQAALKDLRGRYPKLWMDMNHRLTVASPSGAPQSRVPANCGAGVRIGLVAGPVNRGASALSGQKLTIKSFLPIGVKLSSASASTTMASGLIGKSGQLPGANLYVAVITRNRGGANDGTSETAIRGLDWLVTQGVRTIWVPLQGPRNLALDAAIVRLRSRGITVIRSGSLSLPSKLATIRQACQ